MTSVLIIVAAFVGVATLVGGVAILFGGEQTNSMDDRLKSLAGIPSADKSRGGPAEKSSVLQQGANDKPSQLDEVLAKYVNFSRFLAQADSPLSTGKLLLVSLGLGAAGAALCMFARLPFYAVPLAGGILAVVPLLWLVLRRRRRLANFAKQLPEALELISRALRAGHSLASGFHLVAEEMDDPIGKEFNRCFEEQNFGVPLEESLQNLAERIPNLDLKFFATAVILQRQTGGDLAEILDKIGYIVRERFKIWGQVQALTGEGRLSGIVLLGLPPCLFLVMLKLNPNYVMMLFTDPMGQQMLFGAIVMQLLGAFVIKKIITIQV